MSDRVEAAIGSAAALLVLFSAMVDPRISAAMAVVWPLVLAISHWSIA